MKLKVTTVAAMLVILTGCTSDLTEARAKYQCKDLGGVYSIAINGNAFTCNDGTRLKKTIEPLPEGWCVGDTK